MDKGEKIEGLSYKQRQKKVVHVVQIMKKSAMHVIQYIYICKIYKINM